LLKGRGNRGKYEEYLLGSLFKQKGKKAEAKNIFKQLVKCHDPKLRGGAFFHLGEIYLSEKNFTCACTQFRKTLEVIPDHCCAKKYLIKGTAV